MHTTIVRSGLIGLALAAFLGTGPAALAEVIHYKAALAAQGNDSKGTGNAEVDYDTTTKMLTDRFEAFIHLSSEQRQQLYLNMVVPPEVAKRMARHLEQLDLNYTKSPICHQHEGLDSAAPIPAADHGRESRGHFAHPILLR